MVSEEKNVGGRPEWAPTDKERGQIQAWSEAGFTQEQIAERLDVDKKTLRKHCRQELDFARMDMIAAVARNAFRFALGAPAQYDDDGRELRAEVLPQPWAVCFVLKTLGKKNGFTERLELTGKDGKDLISDMTAILAQCSDEELEIIDRAQRILAAHAPHLADRGGEAATRH